MYDLQQCQINNSSTVYPQDDEHSVTLSALSASDWQIVARGTFPAHQFSSKMTPKAKNYGLPTTKKTLRDEKQTYLK